MLRILVVEDNPSLRRLMRIHLTRAGYDVVEAGNGEEALRALEESRVHMMIVDIMMPVMDGFELTEQLRSSNITIPILVVTAKESLEDKRIGFRAGADDYMVKPVEMEEMLLRVEALIRRANLSDEHILRIGETTLDAQALIVRTGGEEIPLRQKEFGLLHLLISYPGRIFTRQALMDEVWGFGTDTEPRTVDVHIKRLREKLLSCTDFTIQTVRGLGYKAELS